MKTETRTFFHLFIFEQRLFEEMKLKKNVWIHRIIGLSRFVPMLNIKVN